MKGKIQHNQDKTIRIKKCIKIILINVGACAVAIGLIALLSFVTAIIINKYYQKPNIYIDPETGANYISLDGYVPRYDANGEIIITPIEEDRSDETLEESR